MRAALRVWAQGVGWMNWKSHVYSSMGRTNRLAAAPGQRNGRAGLPAMKTFWFPIHMSTGGWPRLLSYKVWLPSLTSNYN